MSVTEISICPQAPKKLYKSSRFTRSARKVEPPITQVRDQLHRLEQLQRKMRFISGEVESLVDRVSGAASRL